MQDKSWIEGYARLFRSLRLGILESFKILKYVNACILQTVGWKDDPTVLRGDSKDSKSYGFPRSPTLHEYIKGLLLVVEEPFYSTSLVSLHQECINQSDLSCTGTVKFGPLVFFL
ncbi:hypothetical protein ACET3Z_002596 [Daucus carota]